MTIAVLEVTCRDPIISRDGRPFGAGQGNRMRTVSWPLPSMVAGSLRTAIGKAAEREFSMTTAQELLKLAVAGVFPVANGNLYFPAPRDCIIPEEQGRRVCPQSVKDGGCDWPVEGLRPVMLPLKDFREDFKPKDGPAWWPAHRYAEWLAGADTMTFDSSFLNAPSRDERTHVQLDPETGAAEEGNLFTTAGLSLTHLARYGLSPDAPHREQFAPIQLAVRVSARAWCAETVGQLSVLHPLGGERRLVHWKATTTNSWTCPKAIADALVEKTQVRLTLVTPAIFRDGWKPAWLNEELMGTVAGSNVTVRLVGVSIERWRAVSGWSLADLPNQPRGPKPVKRMVPAGGVYFFEVIKGQAADLKSLWLEPISDDEQERRDGFGLGAWGTW